MVGVKPNSIHSLPVLVIPLIHQETAVDYEGLIIYLMYHLGGCVSDLFQRYQDGERAPEDYYIYPSVDGDNGGNGDTFLYRAKVTADALYVREGPGTIYNDIGYVEKNDILKIYEERNKWLKIHETEERWVYSSFTKRIYY